MALPTVCVECYYFFPNPDPHMDGECIMKAPVPTNLPATEIYSWPKVKSTRKACGEAKEKP